MAERFHERDLITPIEKLTRWASQLAAEGYDANNPTKRWGSLIIVNDDYWDASVHTHDSGQDDDRATTVLTKLMPTVEGGLALAGLAL